MYDSGCQIFVTGPDSNRDFMCQHIEVPLTLGLPALL